MEAWPEGNMKIVSWKSLVLPAPARLLPLLPTANSSPVKHPTNSRIYRSNWRGPDMHPALPQ